MVAVTLNDTELVLDMNVLSFVTGTPDIKFVKFGGEKGGRSGSHMFISMDNKYILKQLRDNFQGSDEKSLLKIVRGERYINYLSKNPKSYLPRFYGIYKNGKKKYIIQNNLCHTQQKSLKFDLKGSGGKFDNGMWICENCKEKDTKNSGRYSKTFDTSYFLGSESDKEKTIGQIGNIGKESNFNNSISLILYSSSNFKKLNPFTFTVLPSFPYLL